MICFRHLHLFFILESVNINILNVNSINFYIVLENKNTYLIFAGQLVHQRRQYLFDLLLCYRLQCFENYSMIASERNIAESLGRLV